MSTAIVYVTDHKGYELTRHSAASVLLTQASRHDIHIFCNGFLPGAGDTLGTLAENTGVRLEFHSIEGIQAPPELRSHITPTTLLKFDTIDRMCNEYARVLYMDGDILVFRDLALDDVSLDGNIVGAVYDIAECGGMTDPQFHINCATSGRSPHYFNAGLMLADCALWRTTSGLRAQYYALLDAHAESCDYYADCVTSDQCVFNRIFERGWKRLPLGFNTQGCALFTEHWDYASVRHYVGPRKFLPVRRWRTDARDLDLLKRVRSSLQLPRLHGAGSGIAYELNRLRNHRLVHAANEAIARVEMMAAQAMQHGSCACNPRVERLGQLQRGRGVAAGVA